MRLIPVEPPVIPVISLDEMKQHLRVDFSDDDALIEAITAAATEEVDGIAGIGRALMEQTWDLYLDGFYPNGCLAPITIPFPPLIEVESVKYFDDDNAQQTLPTSGYEVVGAGGHSPAELRLADGESWPSVYARAEPVIVRFRAGYVQTSASPQSGVVPWKIIAAIKMIAGTLYAQRETLVIGQSAVEIPWAAEKLLKNFRVY